MRDCGHASNGSYERGCRCDACRAAHAKAFKLRKLRNVTGNTYYVDAGPVRDMLLELYEMGYTTREIARFGVGRSTQRALVHRHERTGKPIKKVRRATAEKLSAIRGRRLSECERVPADAATLMVRQWHDAGVPIRRMSQVTGVAQGTLYTICRGGVESVLARTLVALLDHKDDLDYIAGDSKKTRRSRKDTLCGPLSDWEVEEAYQKRQAGAALSELASQYKTNHHTLSRAFKRLEAR